MEVTLTGAHRCGAPADVTIHSARPALFERDSSELQRVVDAVRALLAFECRDLPELRVLGRLKGLPEPVFRGAATAASGWAVRTEQSIRGGAPRRAEGTAGGGGGPLGGRAPLPALGDEGPAVAGLRAGMPVGEAQAAVARTFGVEPAYDPQRGLLTMGAQGCPAGYDLERRSPAPQPGWKCLKAWFTDEQEPRLYRLELVQVLPPDQREAAERALTERFGPPLQRRVDEPTSWWGGRTGEQVVHLAWGRVVEPAREPASGDGPGQPVHALQATVEATPGAVLTSVILYEPAQLGPVRERRPDLQL
jgi:hypothetical protein